MRKYLSDILCDFVCLFVGSWSNLEKRGCLTKGYQLVLSCVYFSTLPWCRSYWGITSCSILCYIDFIVFRGYLFLSDDTESMKVSNVQRSVQV